MLTAIILGAVQGARHSFEPDHLAAVTVMIGDSRNVRRSAWLGAVWGFGHTASLVAICLAVVGFGAVLPAEADRVFTVIVAAILIGLGVRSLWTTRHRDAQRPVRSPVQALVVGAIHGLAGSSALTALVFAAIPDALSRLLYITLFGLGSIVGMGAVSCMAGAWLQRIQRQWLMTSLRVVIGVWSIAVGVMTGLRAMGAA